FLVMEQSKKHISIGTDTSLNDGEKQNIVKSIQDLLKESEIDPYSDIKEPPIALQIDNMTFATLGNFSCITGKPKSRKTYFLSLIIASTLCNNQNKKITTNLSKTCVLHFDTEQSRYHTQKVSRRILSLTNNKEISQENYKCYCLRPYSPEERKKIIMEAIYNAKNVKFVFIDGIADLIVGYNNEESAINIINDLMKWTAELKIHLITIV
ncbi:hypothetical protein IU405_00820, partial [Polaribacter sp. BAL334]|nr:hypothetical protein [Polaribacter sp. BAL334]